MGDACVNVMVPDTPLLANVAKTERDDRTWVGAQVKGEDVVDDNILEKVGISVEDVGEDRDEGKMLIEPLVAA